MAGDLWRKIMGDPRSPTLSGPLRVLAVSVFFAALCGLVLALQQPATYEATAVLQIRPGVDILPMIEGRLMQRDALAATAARQSITGPAPAVRLRTAVALSPLASDAGVSLGLPEQTAGLVISVRLPDGAQAVRVANDLALQVLDLAHAGQFEPDHDRLVFYRSEEDRLWQEIAALKSETMAAGDPTVGAHQLMLLDDQYDAVRKDLAEEEIAARLAQRLWDGQFALLQRASGAVAIRSTQALAVLLMGALTALLAGFAFWAGRQRPLPAGDADQAVSASTLIRYRP